MSDFIALQSVRRAAQAETGSALPNAPIVPATDSPGSATLRRGAAWALRAVAAREHRIADRLDPRCPTPAAAAR